MSYSSTLDILYPFCFAFSILASFILLFRHWSNSDSIGWLVISYFCISHALFVPYLLRNDLIGKVPHFCKTGSLALLIYLPCSFLYVRSVFKSRKIRLIEWLHFLPVTLFLVDNSGYYLSSGAFKLEHFHEEVSTGKFFMPHTHGFIFYRTMFRMIFLFLPAIYWLIQVVIMVRAMVKRSVFLEKNNKSVKWILFYLSFQLMIYMMIIHVFLSSDMNFLYMATQVFGLFTSLVIIITLFVYPSPATLFRDATNFSDQRPVLFDVSLDHAGEYTGRGLPIPVLQPIKEEAPSGIKLLKGLSRKQVQQLKTEVEKIFETEKPFLRHGYSLQDLANALSYPWYQVSALLNQEYGMHFNDFINKRRIDHATRIIKKNKDPNLNINTLADRCGFSNRNSFSAAFKKFTGFSPSEYLKKK